MELKNLLAFQKADLAYKRLKDELARDESYREMVKSKDEFEEAKTRVAKAESAAETIINAYNAAVKTLNAAIARLDELCARAGNEKLSDEEQSEIMEKLEEIRELVSTGEKKTAELKEGADRAIADYKAANKAGRNAREVYGKSKDKFDTLKKSKSGELAKLKTERDTLKEKLPTEEYELYKKKTGAGLLPALVPARVENDVIYCPGCGIQQSGAAKNALDGENCYECESCHRLIYKE